MAAGVFTVAKGIARYYCTLPAANDALLVVLLKSAGLEADDVLNNHDTLASILGTNTEADFTNYARKVVTASITPTEDDTNNWVSVDMPDLTWASAGGVANNSLGKVIVCYRPDTASADSAIIPLTYYDLVTATDGLDLTVQINTAGFYRAA